MPHVSYVKCQIFYRPCKVSGFFKKMAGCMCEMLTYKFSFNVYYLSFCLEMLQNPLNFVQFKEKGLFPFLEFTEVGLFIGHL